MLTDDELAGICDLFGALTREELARARSELAFRRDEEAGPEGRIEAALSTYALVEHDGLVLAGPAAFPTLPEGASDLPHILEAPDREVDREAAGEAVLAALAAEEDTELAREVSYDLEAWAPVDASAVREGEQERL
ncbi:DUF7109 family protein [Halalkalicoccus jeotgali]|uniref:Uncharacterized protein n=1 Tax=Halalkalicoccus jeotgali (strain DSM 18796 / CECT 7217 / JCM 14584 / KCTC 4019 / B3) TaxID=795797 RepID=D8J8H5_HALJB|nr:hypothetical protein [Halalkalicoccus jeotgali]ADJ16221.1 hypothetical protein HacjB3_14200 [Halalkalicoccus jeotgali B3]ELY37296.1 hypothetical protein C497_09428 [Halalkalicoccus jeotgali B3]